MQRSPDVSYAPAPSLAPSCLIVEDEPGIRSIISRVLSHYDLSVGEFTNANEAVASLGSEHPKVVFLDVSLENSDAIEAIRGLAKNHYAGAVQLISGRKPALLEEVKKIGERHGLRMRTPIVKPFGADAIRSVVQEECLGGPEFSEHQVSLSHALKSGWVELWYQPKIDLQNKTLVGAEGVARVRHPKHGLIAPKGFLTDATQMELVELTRLAILTALSDWTAFSRNGMNLKLAVNVPGSVLAGFPLVTLVRERRPKSNDWPGLIFEVTEGDVLEDMDLIREVATQLKLYEVELSIDDFGSGYSSMRRLCDLPCVELKLDQSFVRNCADNGRNAMVCATAIELGHRLGATVTAEGIERMVELQTLRQMGCDFGQGFLFSPALDRDRFIASVQERPRIPKSSVVPRTPA
jgi:EAL domain-containing protein (putative c-di-GMP-specific phosphodiesterase class I)